MRLERGRQLLLCFFKACLSDVNHFFRKDTFDPCLNCSQSAHVKILVIVLFVSVHSRLVDADEGRSFPKRFSQLLSEDKREGQDRDIRKDNLRGSPRPPTIDDHRPSNTRTATVNLQRLLAAVPAGRWGQDRPAHCQRPRA